LVIVALCVRRLLLPHPSGKCIVIIHEENTCYNLFYAVAYPHY